MWDELFGGLFDTDMTAVISVTDFLLCMGVSLLCGLILVLCTAGNSRSKSFLSTLLLLPAVVCVVIMMVNGNVGAGVAVAGAFSLVRFRSAAGSAREITLLFLAMGAGLMAGMGYLAYGLLFTVLMGVLSFLSQKFVWGERDSARTLHITVPEDLNHMELFGDIFERYTTRNKLLRTKTTNMGSLYRLTYDLTLRTGVDEKAMIDELRCRNGNLEISLCQQEMAVTEL